MSNLKLILGTLVCFSLLTVSCNKPTLSYYTTDEMPAKLLLSTPKMEVGQPVELTIKNYADYTPSISWYKDSTLIKNMTNSTYILKERDDGKDLWAGVRFRRKKHDY